MKNTNSKKLKLYFKDANNTQRTVTIDQAKDTYKDADVSAAMDKIIESQVLETKKGLINSKARAEVETIEKAALDVIQA
ncbi:DUF2922 domain-containing protein [Anaerococcus lactolyticus]|uniref:DUF2922 domain-containing protein n=2 Tax=Anaerococcus lactolyticus TaxID=33032 RepID=C2BGP7_9FIRM|nr:DUF2922 domain-containing protein [Anaerococcus lactolyticus]EEI85893.1 hypothetical protein HMPREF0072_1517 [Anaerococcus lactolyticus ATCC 51172]KGF03401.1 hypothetical protein HMPREF1630_07420 [Anaerococcus lactolyticus S7-1-13]